MNLSNIFHFKQTSYIFLTIAIIVIVLVFLNQTKSGTFKIDSNETKEAQNAIFVAPTKLENRVKIRGKIQKREEIRSELGVTHVLLAEDKTVLSYLYSRVNDLDLSAGFNVEVEGIMQKDKLIDGKVIKVERIILK